MRIILPALAAALIFSFPLAQAAESATAAPAPVQAANDYPYKTPKLGRAKFDALLAKPDQLVLIDLRRPDEVSTIGGLPVYLSIQVKDLEKSLAFIPKDRAIVTISNHAHRAGAAADFLAAHGFRVAGTVGVEDYAAEGGQLTKIVPPPPRQAAQP